MGLAIRLATNPRLGWYERVPEEMVCAPAGCGPLRAHAQAYLLAAKRRMMGAGRRFMQAQRAEEGRRPGLGQEPSAS